MRAQCPPHSQHAQHLCHSCEFYRDSTATHWAFLFMIYNHTHPWPALNSPRLYTSIEAVMMHTLGRSRRLKLSFLCT